MWTLRIAATIAAIVTVVLNAHHGYVSATTLEYAVMLAALNAALDMAKTALIPAAATAWRSGLYGIALTALALFPALFCNSVWNAMSQVALTRTAAATTANHDIQSHSRDAETRRRKVAELATLQENPSFQTSAACTLPKTKDARTLCKAVADINAELAVLDTRLNTSAPPDPHPAITWLAEVTKQPHAAIALAVAMAPVLLAELLGSLGFVIAAARQPMNVVKPTSAALDWFSKRRLGCWHRASKAGPATSVLPVGAHSRPGAASILDGTPSVSWSIAQ